MALIRCKDCKSLYDTIHPKCYDCEKKRKKELQTRVILRKISRPQPMSMEFISEPGN